LLVLGQEIQFREPRLPVDPSDPVGGGVVSVTAMVTSRSASGLAPLPAVTVKVR